MSFWWVAGLVFLVSCAHPPPRKSAMRVGPDAVGKPEAGPQPAAPEAAAPEPAARRVDFFRDVRPILESRCQPCHFQGGRMYDRLPFDREDTVHRLGEKLFTRIKAEDEQAVIRQLLSQGQ